MMELRTIDILDLLPQRPPFVLVDCLVDFTPEVVTTEFRVPADGIFTEDGSLTATGLIENIAQTCATRIGYINYISHRPVGIGYIGAIRDFAVLRTPLVGELLTTTIRVKEEIFGMTMVDAEVHSGSELLVRAEMKIALKTPSDSPKGGENPQN